MHLPSLLAAVLISSAVSASAITDAEIAPAALVGKTLVCTVVNGGSPYATTGTWSGTFAASGNAFTIANITGDTVPISTTFTAGLENGYSVVSLAEFVDGRNPAKMTLYTVNGVGHYEVAIQDVFGVGLNGTFTFGAPPVVGPEIEIKQGGKLTDGKAETNFGTTLVGKTGKTKVYTIKNTGEAVLKNIGFSVTGKSKGDFTVSSPKIKSILPGSKVKIRVTFKPSAIGKRKAVLHIRSNDTDEGSFDIKLNGSGTGKK